MWPGPDAHGNATGLTSRSAKRRVARKVRRQRGGVSGRSLDSDHEEGWVEREEERERREREEERERLARLVQVAKERYERAVEKLGTFAGESVEIGEEAAQEEQEQVAEEEIVMVSSPTPTVGVGTVDEPSEGEDRIPSGSRSQPDVGGGLSLGLRAVVYPQDDISEDESESGQLTRFNSPYMPQYLDSPPDPSPPPAEGIINSFRTFNPFSSYVNVHENTTPSPPSPISADGRDCWYSAPSFISLPTHRTPLLSLESRHLAEETSAVLEVLSRAAEIDMDDDAQKKSIEQAYENVGKLRSEYCVPLAEAPAVAPPVQDWDWKCVVCCDDMADMVLIPCHHMVMCEVRIALSSCRGLG